jgi:hypothetical protein
MATPQVISKPSRYMWLASCGDSSNCYLEHALSVNVGPPIRQMHRPKTTNEPSPTAGIQNVGAHLDVRRSLIWGSGQIEGLVTTMGQS